MNYKYNRQSESIQKSEKFKQKFLLTRIFNQILSRTVTTVMCYKYACGKNCF